MYLSSTYSGVPEYSLLIRVLVPWHTAKAVSAVPVASEAGYVPGTTVLVSTRTRYWYRETTSRADKVCTYQYVFNNLNTECYKI